jgi:hypothetical protein
VAILACSLFVMASLSAAADDKKDRPTLSGVWILKGGEPKIEFVDDKVVRISPHGDSAVIAVICEYTVDKAGRVKVKVTDFEGKEEVKDKLKEKLPVGTAFSFNWKVRGDTAKLDDVKGDETGLVKAHLEGEYQKK